ncbi:unnamed protein product [Caenorhabditis nigoni]
MSSSAAAAAAAAASPLAIWRENRKKYLSEKAKNVKWPVTDAIKLKPVFLFDEPVFSIHMCADCRKENRSGNVTMDGDRQILKIKVCDICATMMNAQRRTKFFNYDVLCFKRSEEGGSSIDTDSTPGMWSSKKF